MGERQQAHGSFVALPRSNRARWLLDHVAAEYSAPLIAFRRCFEGITPNGLAPLLHAGTCEAGRPDPTGRQVSSWEADHVSDRPSHSRLVGSRSTVRGVIRSGIVATVAFGALAVLMAAAPVTGQTVATTFDELRLKVKAGDTVYVTNYSGRSEQEARILELTGSSLALSIDGIQRDLVESDVMRIRQRLPDSRKNGALIGFLVGAAGITTGAIVMASPSGSCTGGCVAVNVLYGGGVGALVGLGIDALIQGRKDIYVKSRSQA